MAVVDGRAVPRPAGGWLSGPQLTMMLALVGVTMAIIWAMPRLT